jgi:hypothetical protein
MINTNFEISNFVEDWLQLGVSQNVFTNANFFSSKLTKFKDQNTNTFLAASHNTLELPVSQYTKD